MISIIVPAYNASGTIAAQLDALTDQLGSTTTAPEVIVADNGSTDGTPELVAERWPNVRVIDATARRGPSAARNLGAAAARGELLVFTDADDIVMPGWLAAWSGLGTEYEFGTGPVIHFAHDAVPDGHEAGPLRAPVHLGFLPYALGANLAITRSAFERVGGFPEDWRTAEDIHLSWQLELGGTELSYLPAARVAKRRVASPGAMLRQYYAYGKSDPRLYRMYREAGLRRPSAGATAKSYLGLLARLPLLGSHQQRERWCAQAGRRWGRVVGSARERTLLL